MPTSTTTTLYSIYTKRQRGTVLYNFAIRTSPQRAAQFQKKRYPHAFLIQEVYTRTQDVLTVQRTVIE